MKLNTKERIGLMSAMPQKTGFSDRIVVRAMTEELSIDEKERSEIGLRDGVNGQLYWTKDKEIDFHINKDRERLIKRGFKEFVETNRFIPGFMTEKVFDALEWNKNDLLVFDEVVDEMDKNEQISEENFDVCKKIKEQAPEKETKKENKTK